MDCIKNPYIQTNEWGWGLDPHVVEISLIKLWERNHKPLWIVENGLGAIETFENETVHDTYRIEFLRQAIRSMKQRLN